MINRRPWQEELAIVDRTMKAISGIIDPEELVSVYWKNIGELIQIKDYVAVSRREIEPPNYLVTRSSRFIENFNPWTERDRLPKLSGGVLGEVAYANKPVFIDDLPARLAADDPGWFYLQGFATLIALPQHGPPAHDRRAPRCRSVGRSTQRERSVLLAVRREDRYALV